MKNMITTWHGKRIEELSKKELLEALKCVAEEVRLAKEEKAFLGDDYFELLAKKRLGLR